jgi:transposase-like protein
MRTYTIKDLEQQFPTEEACLEWLKNYRWPKGITCKKCQRVTNHYRAASRRSYECAFCGNHVHPTAGTILHKSPTPLRSWFYAVFLMSTTRTGISAKQLQRELGVTYKTAWRIFSQVRKLMAQDGGSLFGAIEADETYVGGKHTGKRGRGAEGKTIVAGIVERKGKASVRVVPDVKARTLLPIIQQHIPAVPGTVVYTDEMPSYNRLTSLGYAHETVRHAAKQYVNGAIHTQTIDGLWSNVKRGIDGVNHAVSPQHLQSYLDSYVFRYNHRYEEQPMFAALLGRVAPSGLGP